MGRRRLRLGCTQPLNIQWMDVLCHPYNVRNQYVHLVCNNPLNIQLTSSNGSFDFSAAALAQAFFYRRVYRLSQRLHRFVRTLSLGLIAALSIVSILGAMTTGVLVRTIFILYSPERPISIVSR